MTPAEARNQIMKLTSEVAANPDRAAELAPKIEQLGQIIQATPGANLSATTITPPIKRSMCVAHDKVCKGHQICTGHTKKVANE